MFMNLISFIPAPYRIWAAVAAVTALIAALAVSHGYVYALGESRERDAAAAVRLKEITIAQEQYQKEVVRGNALANKLAASEAKIVYQTKEVIKYVPQVTTGKPCLSASAVKLLNTRPDDTNTSNASVQLVTESPAAPAATDSDVAYWIAEANGQYDICATRLNSLIDFENAQ